MPDPTTLDAEGDDNMPLNIVQEKAKIERSASQRQSATAPPPPQARPAPAVDLFDDFTPAPSARPATIDVGPRAASTGPASRPAAAKQPQDSLLGLDFFGAPASGNRPSSAASNPTPATNSRGDLKNSILSLYSAAPQPAPQPQHERQPSFGGMSAAPAPKQDAFGGLADAFGGLSFPSTTTAKSSPPTTAPKATGFGGLSFPSATSKPQAAPVPLSGGSFFDSLPSKAPAVKPTVTSPTSNGLDFSFTQRAPPPQPAAAPAPKPAAVSMPADLFAADDFGGFASSTPAAAPPKPAPAPQVTSPTMGNSAFSSPFNLSSQPATAPKPATQPLKSPAAASGNGSMFDPWASGNDNSPWGAAEPTATKAAPTVDLGKPPERITPNDISGGWGQPMSSAQNSKPTTARQASITADEDFGGWASAASPAAAAPPAKQGGFSGGGGSDPFDNPWG
jgi:stromal membrane-associated protein